MTLALFLGEKSRYHPSFWEKVKIYNLLLSGDKNTAVVFFWLFAVFFCGKPELIPFEEVLICRLKVLHRMRSVSAEIGLQEFVKSSAPSACLLVFSKSKIPTVVIDI